MNLVCRKKVQRGDGFFEHLPRRFVDSLEVPPGYKQCQRFVNTIVRSDKLFVVGSEPSLHAIVVRIIRHETRKPRSGVNEDHDPSPYSTRSWSAPLKVSPGFSFGSASIRANAS